MMAHYFCEGKHTVTEMLRSTGRQNQDWSADYRLYQSHLDPVSLFKPVFDEVEALLSPHQPLILAVDDSNFGKRGKKIPNTGWLRDPLGPGFQTNLKWGQKFVQISAAIAPHENLDQVRMIPIQVRFMDKIPKLKKEASKEEIQVDQQKRAENSASSHALKMLDLIQNQMKVQSSGQPRKIILLGDGGYSNARLLQNVPKGIVYIGRVRGDMHINQVPTILTKSSVGRPLAYGPKLPTPEELRKDKSTKWTKLTVTKWGKPIEVQYKVLPKVKWTKSGEKKVVQIIVIRALRFKKTKKGRWFYKKPTYLICTDSFMKVSRIIELYFLRWDIEVNFKEEKQIFGAGQAQVRHPQSVQSAPALTIAAYSVLHLAGINAYGAKKLPPAVQPPKWRKMQFSRRMSTSDLIRQLRFEANMGMVNFSDFASVSPEKRSPKNKNLLAGFRSNPL